MRFLKYLIEFQTVIGSMLVFVHPDNGQYAIYKL